ncbi:hypothetical protein GOP47_0005674, partial [Adiantum capillus-veneris]
MLRYHPHRIPLGLSIIQEDASRCFLLQQYPLLLLLLLFILLLLLLALARHGCPYPPSIQRATVQAERHNSRTDAVALITQRPQGLTPVSECVRVCFLFCFCFLLLLF